MDLFTYLSEKLDITLNLHKTILELEHLNNTWVVKGVPWSESPYGRIPGEEEIRMWSIPRASMKVITMIAIISEAKTIIDVGTSAGYSAIWLSIAAYLNGGHVYTVETFEPKVKLAQQYIQKAKMGKYITLIYDDAANFLQKWPDSPIDFLLLDADKENHLKYFKSAEDKFSDRAVTIVDNASNFRSLMADFFAYVEKSNKYLTNWLDFENGLQIITRRNLDGR